MLCCEAVQLEESETCRNQGTVVLYVVSWKVKAEAKTQASASFVLRVHTLELAALQCQQPHSERS